MNSSDSYTMQLQEIARDLRIEWVTPSEAAEKIEAIALAVNAGAAHSGPNVSQWIPVDPPEGHTPHGKPGRPIYYWSEGQWYRFDTPPLPASTATNHEGSK